MNQPASSSLDRQPAPPPASDGADDQAWQYSPVPDRFDEMVDEGGAVRPHWRPLMDRLRGRGAADVDHALDQARRQLRETGPAMDQPQGRGWDLDLIPRPIDPETWAHLAAAVEQRARLINRLLLDLYGPQQCLTEQILPPSLVLSHPGFLRAARQLPSPDGMQLLHYAVDLVRGSDGAWWVARDHVDAPLGVGRALENRITLSRILPDAFRRMRVQRQAGWFRQLRDTLVGLAPTHRDAPRVVVLTGGVHDPGYFEHAYLARYLGFNLVEGADLVVRDHWVYLKTLNGLLPVNVILRGIPGEALDPLELDDESTTGVAGLLGAVRAGSVVIANSVGASALDGLGYAPFLPRLAHRWLGEGLRIPDVPTWWCGHGEAREHVTGSGEMILDRSQSRTADALAPDAPPEELERRVQEMTFEPYAWVGRRQIEAASTPTWRDGRLQRASGVLRLFVAATGPDRYAAMPGGLVRVGDHVQLHQLDAADEGLHQDVWVVHREGELDTFTLLGAAGARTQSSLSRAGFILPSRVADNMFWLGRYVERIDFTARVIRCLLTRLSDAGDMARVPEAQPLVAHLAAQGRWQPPLSGAQAQGDEALLLQRLRGAIYDDAQSASLAQDAKKLVRAAVAIRDRLSVDAWRVLDRVVQELAPTPTAAGADGFDIALSMNRIIDRISAFTGQSAEGMTRDRGWRFLDIGRRVERGWNLAVAMRKTMIHVDAGDAARLGALLELANSVMTYQSRYVFGVQAEPVLDLLLADETNPRSLGYQLRMLEDHLRAFAATPDDSPRDPEQKLVLDSLTAVRLADLADYCMPRGQRRTRLDALLRRVVAGLDELSEQLTGRYLSHAALSRRDSEPG